jgi:hypothetical protein
MEGRKEGGTLGRRKEREEGQWEEGVKGEESRAERQCKVIGGRVNNEGRE